MQNPDNQIIQIGFAQAYQCELQKKTMETLWRRESINLFTCDIYHKRETKSILYSKNYKDKGKFAIGVFLPDRYTKELVMDSDI